MLRRASAALASRWRAGAWASMSRDQGTYATSDIYAQRAKKEGLRSRAAYKLEELDRRCGHFLRRGAYVVDLGAAPGGFSVFASGKIETEPRDVWERYALASGSEEATTMKNDGADRWVEQGTRRTLGGDKRRRQGRLVCVDVSDMEPVEGASFIRGDARDDETIGRIAQALNGHEADVVLCDMAPATTSDPGTNHVRSMEVAMAGLRVGRELLRNGGVLCVKLFQGSDEAEFREVLESEFVKVKAVRPRACRKVSREIYYVATGFVPQHMVSPSCNDVYDEVSGTLGASK